MAMGLPVEETTDGSPWIKGPCSCTLTVQELNSYPTTNPPAA